MDAAKRALPGSELISQGRADLARGVPSAEALLVSIGASRLRASGIQVPEPMTSPEHRLYELLREEHGDGAHSRYNALLRRLASYARALECESGRLDLEFTRAGRRARHGAGSPSSVLARQSSLARDRVWPPAWSGAPPTKRQFQIKPLADAERVHRLLRALGAAATSEGRAYLTGGATAVLFGWRSTTIDVDIALHPEADAVLREVPRLKNELAVNVELVSPAISFRLPAAGKSEASSSTGTGSCPASTSTRTCKSRRNSSAPGEWTNTTCKR